MTPHGKKMIAPVIITIAFLLYLAFYAVFIIKTVETEPFVILFGIPLILLGIGMVYVLFARIREIRSGEENDLGKY